MDLKALLNTAEYQFLREEPRLGGRVMLLGLCGSYGYGTNRADSDIDLRGVTLNLPSDLLGLTSFEQYENSQTDTVIYSFNKFIKLLLNCNPNTIEILGLDDDQYAVRSSLGCELLAHRQMFLSMRAAASFGQYACAQLRRLQNAVARDTLSQSLREQHIMKSVQYALDDFNRKHETDREKNIRLFIDKAATDGLETEIFLEGTFERYPLRRCSELMITMNSVLRDYDRIGRRNRKKDEDHLNKHAMHLIRLLMMGIDILEKAEIKTHRPEADLELLRSIRRGDYMQGGVMVPEFYSIVTEYERRFTEAQTRSTLPEAPDLNAIGLFMEKINRRVVMQELE